LYGFSLGLALRGWMSVSGVASFGILTVSALAVSADSVIDTVKRRGCQRMPKDIKKQKTRISTRLEAGFCTLLDFLKRVLGGDRWT
jgi:hypothetical protein